MTALPDYVINDNLEERLDEIQKKTLNDKYLDRDGEGNIFENYAECFYRVASSIAGIEKDYDKSVEEVEAYAHDFYEMMTSLDFLPAGRILSNAGTSVKALLNCYVLHIPDSIKGIFSTVTQTALIHKEGGGTGFNFSSVRPRGSYVKKSKGVASGPVSFLEVFDKQTETMNSGNRRGANMGILDVVHPDVLEFVYEKSEEKLVHTLSNYNISEKKINNFIKDYPKIFNFMLDEFGVPNFNLSVGITDYFMQKFVDDEYYKISFDGECLTAEELMNFQKNIQDNKLGGSRIGQEPEKVSLQLDGDKIINKYSDEVIGRVNEGFVELHSSSIMDIVARLAWKTADPGVIFVNRLDRDNPLPGMGVITATNPCGEQPLLPYGGCDLGSINLNNMIKKEKGEYFVDYDKLKKTTEKAVRFLDNVIDLNEGPIPEVEEMVRETRRIGLGVMGWANMLLRLGVPYSSEEAEVLANEVMGFISETAREYSAELAEEKGVFPAFDESIYSENYESGLVNKIRNPARTTIAPTGSISMVAGVNGGIEPYYTNIFTKNVRGGEVLSFVNPILEEVAKERGFYSEELFEKIKKNGGSVQGLDEVPEDVQEVFKTSHEISYEDHIRVQAAFQRNIDNAVSKTINLPHDATVEDVKNAYSLAYEMGLKGITVYRDGSKRIQPLESKHEEDMDSILPEYTSPVSLPECIPSIKIKQPSPFGNMHITIPYDHKTERPVEIFAQLGKGGDIAYTSLEAICRLASVSLRTGVEPREIVHQLKGIKSNLSSAPSREGKVTSLGDAVGRALEKYMYMKENYGIKEVINSSLNLDEVINEVSDNMRKNEGSNNVLSSGGNDYKIKCPECGEGHLIMEEGCEHCSQCNFYKCG